VQKPNIAVILKKPRDLLFWWLGRANLQFELYNLHFSMSLFFEGDVSPSLQPVCPGATVGYLHRELSAMVNDSIKRDTCIPSDVAPNAK
jgi:hypothetical protein